VITGAVEVVLVETAVVDLAFEVPNANEHFFGLRQLFVSELAISLKNKVADLE
jgi:hypothetical protein